MTPVNRIQPFPLIADTSSLLLLLLLLLVVMMMMMIVADVLVDSVAARRLSLVHSTRIEVELHGNKSAHCYTRDSTRRDATLLVGDILQTAVKQCGSRIRNENVCNRSMTLVEGYSRSSGSEMVLSEKS